LKSYFTNCKSRYSFTQQNKREGASFGTATPRSETNPFKHRMLSLNHLLKFATKKKNWEKIYGREIR